MEFWLPNQKLHLEIQHGITAWSVPSCFSIEITHQDEKSEQYLPHEPFLGFQKYFRKLKLRAEIQSKRLRRRISMCWICCSLRLKIEFDCCRENTWSTEKGSVNSVVTKLKLKLFLILILFFCFPQRAVGADVEGTKKGGKNWETFFFGFFVFPTKKGKRRCYLFFFFFFLTRVIC